MRSVNKVYAEGGVNAIENLRKNVERICWVSLFSGLGGAELAVLNNFHAIDAKCTELGLTTPTKPSISAEVNDVQGV